VSFSSTAGQALYLNDLFSFFEMRPKILSAENPRPFSAPDPRGLRLRGCRLHLSRRRALGGPPFELHPRGRRSGGAGRRERRRQDHAGQAVDPALRSGRRPHPARRPRPSRVRPRRPAGQHGRHLPGFRALQFHRRRQHRGRPHLGARRPAPHRAGSEEQPGRRGHRQPAGRLPAAHRQALQERRRTVGRRMAEGRDCARLYA